MSTTKSIVTPVSTLLLILLCLLVFVACGSGGDEPIVEPVIDTKPTSIQIKGKTTLTINETAQYTVTPEPTTSAHYTLIWAVSDSTTAQVDQNGKVKAFKANNFLIVRVELMGNSKIFSQLLVVVQ